MVASILNYLFITLMSRINPIMFVYALYLHYIFFDISRSMCHFTFVIIVYISFIRFADITIIIDLLILSKNNNKSLSSYKNNLILYPNTIVHLQIIL